MAAAPLVKVGYAEPVLPDVTRVLACLHEKEIKFERVDIGKGKCGGHAVDQLLNLQAKASARAHGLVFNDGQEMLFESRAICRYLVEKYADRGNRTLLGRDSLERLSVEQWLKSEEHSFDPPSWTLVFYLAFAPTIGLKPDDEVMKESEGRLSRVLDVYDQRLADSRFLAGDEFTLADLFHLPNSYYLAKQHAFASRENVSRWVRDMCGRESWRRVTDLLKQVPVERVPILAGDEPLLPNQSQHFAAATPFTTRLSSPGQGAAASGASPSTAYQQTPELVHQKGSPFGEGTDDKESGQHKAADEVTTTSQPTTNNKHQDRTGEQTQESRAHSGSASKETPKPGVPGTEEGKGSPPFGQGTDVKESGQKYNNNVSQDLTRLADSASPPSGLKSAEATQRNTEQDLKQSIAPPSSASEGPSQKEIYNTADKVETSPTGQGTKENESGQKSNNHAFHDSTKQEDRFSPCSESKDAADQDNSKRDLQQSLTPSGSMEDGPHRQVVSAENVTQDSKKLMGNVPPPSGLKNAPVNQDTSEQDPKASPTSPSSRNQAPTKEEVSNTAHNKGSSPPEQGTNYVESGYKSHSNMSKDSKKLQDNVSSPLKTENAAVNRENSEQDFKESTTLSSSRNQGPPKEGSSNTEDQKGSIEPADNVSPTVGSKNAGENQDNSNQDNKQSTRTLSSTKDGPPRDSSSSGQGTEDKKLSQKSSNDVSKDSTKPADRVSPPSESKNAEANEDSSKQELKQSTTPLTSTKEGPPKEKLSSTVDKKGSSRSELSTNDKESGHKSDNTVSKDSTKPVDNVPPPSGSKSAAANEDSSNQHFKQSTKPSSSTNEGSPKDSTEPVDKVSPSSESKKAAANQDTSKQGSEHSIASSSSTKEWPPEQVVVNTPDKKGSTKPKDNAPPPSGLKNAAVNQDTSQHDSKASSGSPTSKYQDSLKEEVFNTADEKGSSTSGQGTNYMESGHISHNNISKESKKLQDNVSPPIGSKNAAVNQDNSEQDSENSTSSSSSRHEGPPKERASDMADKKDTYPLAQGKSDKNSAQKNGNSIPKESTKPEDNVSPLLALKNAAVNQVNSEQNSKESTISSSSRNQGPPREEMPNTAHKEGQGINYMASGHKSHSNNSKESTNIESNVSHSLGSKNAAVNQENSEQDLKESTASASYRNQDLPKEQVSNTADKKGTSTLGQGTSDKNSDDHISKESTKLEDNASTPLGSMDAAVNQANPEQDSKESTSSSSSRNQGPPQEKVSNTADKKGTSPLGQGESDKNSAQKSDNNNSKESKLEGNVTPHLGSKHAEVNQENSQQDSKESTTSSSSRNQGPPKEDVSNTKDKGQGTNDTESGHKSHSNISKESIKVEDNVSPPLGSKDAAVNQENSEQDSKVSTTSSSPRDQGPPKDEVSNTADKEGSSPSGQGANYTESDHKSHSNISKESTKLDDNVSPPLGSKNSAVNQENAEQDSKKSTTLFSSRNQGPPKAGVSNTADKEGLKNAADNQDNTNQAIKQSTTTLSSTQERPPKEDASSTATEKGTNDKESGHKSDNNVPRDSTKPEDSVSPPSGLKKAAANQDSHPSIAGSEETGSPSAGSSQSPS